MDRWDGRVGGRGHEGDGRAEGVDERRNVDGALSNCFAPKGVRVENTWREIKPKIRGSRGLIGFSGSFTVGWAGGGGYEVG